MQILPPSTGKAYEPYIADLKSWFTAPADETFLYFKFEGLPRGLSYNEFTGDLSGFPYDKGEFYIIITAYTSKRIPLSSPPKFETLTRKASTFFNVGPGKPSIKPNQNFSATLGYNALLPVEFDDINNLSVANLQVTSGELPPGCFINERIIAGRPTSVGSFTFELTATGPGGVSAPVPVSITVNSVILPNQVFNAKVGVPFYGIILLTDQQNRPQTTWSSFGLGSTKEGDNYGLSLDPNSGIVTGTPFTQGNFSPLIQARGPSGEGQSLVTFIVSAGAPIINEGQSVTGKIGQNFSHTFSLTDISNRPVTNWEATGLPAGLTLNTSTGLITGTPQSMGSAAISLKATGPGGAHTKTATISITEGVPIIKSGQILSGSVGVDFSKNIELDDALNRPVTSWSASGLPAGLIINPTTGVITGMPTAQGSYNVSVTATGPGGKSTPVFVNVTVAKIAAVISIGDLSHVYDGNIKGALVSGGPSISVIYSGLSSVPVSVGSYSVRAFFPENSNFTAPEATATLIISAGAPNLKNGQVFSAKKNLESSHSVIALDLANRPITSWSATGLPAGLTINPNTGVISGTVSELGASTITVTATGPGGTDTKTATFSVSFSEPEVANQTHTIKIGESFEALPDVSNAMNAPVDSFTVTSSLPAGLQLNRATGRVFGIPTQYSSSPTITSIRARNAAGDLIYQVTFNFVHGTPRPQNKNFVGVIDAQASFNLEGTDIPNYKIETWELSSPLPAGLTLNPTTGAITGTPTSPVTQTFTATATGPGGTATSQVVLDIGLPVAEIVPFSFEAELESPVTISIELASGSFSAPTEWIATGLPKGLQLYNGVISGTALAAGEFEPQITIKNKYGQSNKVVKITVPKGAPRISAGQQSLQLKTDRKFSRKILTDMPEHRPVTTWSASGLPVGLSISSDGIISGFAQSPGTFTASITAKSDFGTTSQNLQLVVTGNRFYGVKTPVLQPGRTVRTFSSGLVAVTESYKMRPAFESTARAMFAEGNLLDTESTSNTPLIIYPAPDFRSGDAGFVECTVTAYGITNSQPVKTTNKRVQSVVVLDKVIVPGGAITFTEKTEQHLVNYHVLKTAVPKGSSVAMPTGDSGIVIKPGYTLNAELILERYDVTNYGGYDEVVVASGYKVKFTQI